MKRFYLAQLSQVTERAVGKNDAWRVCGGVGGGERCF